VNADVIRTLTTTAMAEFTAQPDDLREIVDIRVRETFRRGVPYPLVSLIIAALAWKIFLPVALVATGAAAAWGFSLWREVQSLRGAYLWRYAWLQEAVVLRVGDEGVEWSTARGVALTKWTELKVRKLETCFVLEDEGEDVGVIPR
jgi:hypothetical protein